MMRWTLTETKTNNDTEADKMALVPNGIGLSVQNEHVHAIIYEPFLSSLLLVSVSVSVKAPLQASDRFEMATINKYNSVLIDFFVHSVWAMKTYYIPVRLNCLHTRLLRYRLYSFRYSDRCYKQTDQVHTQASL